MTRAEFPPVEWADGYPTEESLEALSAQQAFPANWQEGATYLRRELSKCAEHCCASYHEEETEDLLGKACMHLHFSTGGWSGAEDLVDALLDKFWIKYLYIQWNRGGHYIFEAPL